MTNKTKHGGQAYPENVALCPNTGQVYPASEFHAQHGMTLRQYYAGQALIGLIIVDKFRVLSDLSGTAFKMADAMIAHEEA